jgi:hypothetical protein
MEAKSLLLCTFLFHINLLHTHGKKKDYLNNKQLTMALRTSDIDTNDKPWNSINSMLMQNKCWLCCNTFAKGKQKTGDDN